MSEYVDTARGTCPDCEERNPGHIYVHEAPSNSPAWECPICGGAFGPHAVDAEEGGR